MKVDEEIQARYRSLPPAERPKLRKAAQFLQDSGKIQPVTHLYDQVDQESGPSAPPVPTGA